MPVPVCTPRYDARVYLYTLQVRRRAPCLVPDQASSGESQLATALSHLAADEGLFEQKPGCPSHVRWTLDTSKLALSRSGIHLVCGGGLLQ